MELKNVIEIKRFNVISVIKVCLVTGIILGLLCDLYAWSLASYFYDSEIVKYICRVAELEAKEGKIAKEEEAKKPKKSYFSICSRTIAPTEAGLKYEGIFGYFEASRPAFFLMLPIVFIARIIIFGIALTFIYNVVAKIVGGIRFYTNA